MCLNIILNKPTNFLKFILNIHQIILFQKFKKIFQKENQIGNLSGLLSILWFIFFQCLFYKKEITDEIKFYMGIFYDLFDK